MPDSEAGTSERQPDPDPQGHDVQVIVVSSEEGSDSVAEFWAGDRQIGVTWPEDGELTLRIWSTSDDLVLGAHALAKASADADRLLSLY